MFLKLLNKTEKMRNRDIALSVFFFGSLNRLMITVAEWGELIRGTSYQILYY